jgi:hypothetical protein
MSRGQMDRKKRKAKVLQAVTPEQKISEKAV